ncbi:hypothetical protein LCGC14_2151610 [marine sediment metagenome]|uniref:Uncharacterized protein n=1 Tax=marine sediment metagenome TaxID=412755 RepID=A0A0F9DVC2_9ZZZZ
MSDETIEYQWQYNRTKDFCCQCEEDSILGGQRAIKELNRLTREFFKHSAMPVTPTSKEDNADVR